jgi:hypothetical protein
VIDRLYPHSRVKARTVVGELSSAYRIIWSGHVTAPLGFRTAPSRFCDGHSYSVVYAARTFETAFIEVVVRDRFIQKKRRDISYSELTTRCWARLATKKNETLSLLDLRGPGCLDIGAPTDATNARNHAAGRALGFAIYNQHPNIDGFIYSSRLTGADCFMFFDRTAKELIVVEKGNVVDHDALPDVLQEHHIRLHID